MTILWAIALAMTAIFLVLLMLLFLRKAQFDAIHQNFLDLEDAYGGQVIRGGFAVRPRYAGRFKGQDIVVSISTEKTEGERRYYIAVSMEAASRLNFFIKSTDWLGKKEVAEDQKERTLSILNGQYLLEAKSSADLKKVDLAIFEKLVANLPPFAYILIGNSRMLLERISQRILDDTKLEAMQPVFEGMYQLKAALE